MLSDIPADLSKMVKRSILSICLKLMLKQSTKLMDLFMCLFLVILKALKQLFKTSYALGLCTSLPVSSELNLCIKRFWTV